LGGLLAEVLAYRFHAKLDFKSLQEIVDTDAAAAVSAILANRVDGTSMQMIRTAMIGCALLEDKAGIERWATEGLHRSKRVGGPWFDTERQWQCVLDDPSRFILYARQLKFFLNLN
jgi:hypothetical protein